MAGCVWPGCSCSGKPGSDWIDQERAPAFSMRRERRAAAPRSAEKARLQLWQTSMKASQRSGLAPSQPKARHQVYSGFEVGHTWRSETPTGTVRSGLFASSGVFGDLKCQTVLRRLRNVVLTTICWPVSAMLWASYLQNVPGHLLYRIAASRTFVQTS